jgi:hypothetical protein
MIVGEFRCVYRKFHTRVGPAKRARQEPQQYQCPTHKVKMSVGGLTTYGINDGFLDGMIRGFKAGILGGSDYANLQQCDTLEGEAALTAASTLQ